MDEQSRQYGQQNLTLPHDMVQLPSEGLYYKNKKKAVKVGYLTAADENILMGGGDNLTYNLLRSKLYEPDMKIDDMLEGDVEAILVFLRNTGFGPEVDMNLVDPQTKKPFKTTVILDQLSIVKGQLPGEDGTFTTKLPKSEAVVKLKPMSYGDINEIQKMIDSYPQGRTAPRVTWRLNKEIVEVNGTTDKAEPRLDMTREVIAPSGEKLTVNVGFGVEFFRPFF